MFLSAKGHASGLQVTLLRQEAAYKKSAEIQLHPLGRQLFILSPTVNLAAAMPLFAG
jgi:hypothetical protein